MKSIINLRFNMILLYIVYSYFYLVIVYAFDYKNLHGRHSIQRPNYETTSIITHNKHNFISNHYNNNINHKNNIIERCMLKKEKIFEIPELITSPSTPITTAATTATSSIFSLDKIWTARIILLTVSAFYGTNFGCVKVLGEALNPGVAAVLRFSIASLVFSPHLIRAVKSNKQLVLGGLEVGLYSSIGYWAQAESLLTTPASTTAFICSLAVIVVPLLNLLETKRTNGQDVIASLLPALLAATGVAALELGGSDLPGVGDLWAFLQPLFFGLGFWRIERHIKLCRQEGDAQAFTGAMMAVVAVFSIVWTSHDFVLPLFNSGGFDSVTTALKDQLLASQDWKVAAALLWTGVVTTALTSFGENLAMQSLDAAESTIIYSTEPLWGTAFAALTLGESVGWNTFFGAVLILSACVWSSLGAKVAGILSSAQLAAAEGLEEVSGNMSVNLAELVEKLQNKPDLG